MSDLISRQDAIALLASLKREKPLDWFDGDYSNGIGDCIEALTNMPSAESELQAEIADLQSQLESWQHAAQYPRD